MKHCYGRDLAEATALSKYTNTTTPLVSDVVGLEDFDSIGIQLVADSTRTIELNATDHVVASTHTWTFANGTFTADDVGGTLTVAGAANSNNNATVTISSVTNSTTIVTSGTQTNETFNPATVTAVVTDTQLVGSWKVEVSNNFVAKSGGLAYGDPQNAGRWTDITSAFSPTIATVTATASTQNQYAQLDLTAKKIRFTFTPTAGVGKAIALIFAKSWS